MYFSVHPPCTHLNAPSNSFRGRLKAKDNFKETSRMLAGHFISHPEQHPKHPQFYTMQYSVDRESYPNKDKAKLNNSTN